MQPVTTIINDRFKFIKTYLERLGNGLKSIIIQTPPGMGTVTNVRHTFPDAPVYEMSSIYTILDVANFYTFLRLNHDKTVILDCEDYFTRNSTDAVDYQSKSAITSMVVGAMDESGNVPAFMLNEAIKFTGNVVLIVRNQEFLWKPMRDRSLIIQVD